MNNAALFKIGYGLYVLTAKDDTKDNGCLINTVLQVTSAPTLVGVVAVNKQNYTHDMITKTGSFNVSMLTTETPFNVFEHFGFKSGADIDKLAGYKDVARSKNGVLYLQEYTNAYLSFRLTDTIDFGTHTMFKGEITDGEVLSNAESLTYAYYHKHIKPSPQPVGKGYRCSICNYIYDGQSLPHDFICPVCKHGASDFIKI